MKKIILLVFISVSFHVAGQSTNPKPYTPGSAMKERVEEIKAEDQAEAQRKRQNIQPTPTKTNSTENPIQTPPYKGTSEFELMENRQWVKVQDSIDARAAKGTHTAAEDASYEAYAKAKEVTRIKDLSATFEQTGAEQSAIERMYDNKMDYYLYKKKDYKTALMCHDSLTTYLNHINKPGYENRFTNFRTYEAYKGLNDHENYMRYYLKSSAYHYDKERGSFDLADTLWRAFKQQPNHLDYLDSIKTIMKIARQYHTFEEHYLHVKANLEIAQCDILLGNYTAAEDLMTASIDYFIKHGHLTNKELAQYQPIKSYYYLRSVVKYKQKAYRKAREDFMNSLDLDMWNKPVIDKKGTEFLEMIDKKDNTLVITFN